MVFRLARTFSNPASSQTGFPAPGTGAQTTGPASRQPGATPWFSSRPTKGVRSWLFPSRDQRGFPSPENRDQARPKGSLKVPPQFGGVLMKWTPYFDRGAAAYVPNFGKVLTNPIGAGIAVPYRPQASYGLAGQYADGAIWWTSQAIPTSITPQSLTSPQVLGAILSKLQVQAVVRTTG